MIWITIICSYIVNNNKVSQPGRYSGWGSSHPRLPTRRRNWTIHNCELFREYLGSPRLWRWRTRTCWWLTTPRMTWADRPAGWHRADPPCGWRRCTICSTLWPSVQTRCDFRSTENLKQRKRNKTCLKIICHNYCHVKCYTRDLKTLINFNSHKK